LLNSQNSYIAGHHYDMILTKSHISANGKDFDHLLLEICTSSMQKIKDADALTLCIGSLLIR